MELDRFQYLLQQYRHQQLSAAEREELLSLASQADDAAWDALAGRLEEAGGGQPAHLGKTFLDNELARVLSVDRLPPSAESLRPVRRFHIWRWVAAAGVLLLAALGSYRWLRPHQPGINGGVSLYSPAQIAPGREGAILTLDDGRQVVLDSLQNGTIASQQGTQVVLSNGRLEYDAHRSSATAFNTISTPNGRQYQVVLPDGTKIWLNAASSLRYPTAFTGKERVVELSGEAYFEVTRQSAAGGGKMPFIVSTPHQQVQVLGTSFNVNAYRNELTVKTTLLEGKVRVAGIRPSSASNTPAGGVDLLPGQQAITTVSGQGTGNLTVSGNPDLTKVMAWKNGAFNFDGLPLEEAMRQLERWYDIRVTYENGIPDIRFFGEVDRNMNLGELLEMLAGTGLEYRLEAGGQLVVINKHK